MYIAAIASFISVIIFSIPIGYSVSAFVKGVFPAKGGIPSNCIVFGDKKVDPKMLRGARARLLSLLFISLFTLFLLAIYSQNTIIGSVHSNILAIVLGLFGGVFLYKKMFQL